MTAKWLSGTAAAALALAMVLGSGVSWASAEPEDEGDVDCTTITSLPKPTDLAAERTDSGEVRLSWQHEGSCVTGFTVYLGLSSSPVDGEPVLPADASEREMLLTADVLKKLGAALGSGRHFYARVQAVSDTLASSRSSAVVAMAGQPKTSPEAGAARVKVAAYNLAFTPELSRKTLAKRRPGVARQIVNSGASVIALSESVQIRGRSDTQLGPLMSKIRSEQRKTGKSAAWRFTRSTRYAVPGRLVGGDGTRILYNKSRVSLLSKCSEITKVKKTYVKKVKRKGKIKRIKRKKTVRVPYSSSCTIKLPRVGHTIYQRWAPIVKFADRKTGQRFWFVSAHLEVRKGERYDRNRSSQLRAILRAIEQKNTHNEPVIIAGDLNLSASRTPDLGTLNSRLVRGGFVSSVTAPAVQNLQYPTFNGWRTPAASKWGYAGRLDHVYARGRVYFADYETVLGRASDHNLVRTTAWLK